MRVVLVDDSILVREGVTTLLAAAGHQVSAALARAEGLDAVIAADPPDAVVLDIRMPPTHTDEGLRAAQRIRAAHPAVGILVLSQYMVPEYAARLLTSGQTRTGYLLKERVLDRDQLSDALHRIVGGGTVIDPELVADLMRAQVRDSWLDRLSEREREVLTLMAEGLSDRGIAERLQLSVHTVRSHVQHVFDKLGIPEGAEQNRRVGAVLDHLRHSHPPTTSEAHR